MAETSYYWSGTSTGDASLAPYTPLIYSLLQRKTLSRSGQEGVIRNFLNTLNVVGVSGGIAVDTGSALVDGTFYLNTSQITISVSTPTVNPRIDRVVLRKNYNGQTIRIAIITGTEDASPTAPPVSQLVESLWEVSLATVLITVGGVITVTMDEEYEISTTPLALNTAFAHIETIVTEGDFEDSVVFANIPQKYKNLILFAYGKIAEDDFPGSDSIIQSVEFNEDEGNSYSLIGFWADENDPIDAHSSSAGSTWNTVSFPSAAVTNNKWRAQAMSIFPNYSGSNFKTSIVAVHTNVGSTGIFSNINLLNYGMWLDDDGTVTLTIGRIDWASDLYASGTRFSLYGLK